MPRTARASVGGVWYHVLNRGNRREAVFHKSGDYDAFVEASSDARTRLPLDILGYCLMPNHFHLVIRPQGDGDLGRWVQWSLMAHPRRYHRQYRTSGHVWQGRFKAFPIQDDDHLRTVGLPDTRRLPFAEGGVADTHRLARGILIAANHSEWGCLEPPFVRRGEGEVKVGARRHITIQPSGRKGMSFRPTVLVADPERELRWLGRFWLPGLFDGEHSFGEMRSSWSQCHGRRKRGHT
jgi:REP element-mobilizing transposase RayT